MVLNNFVISVLNRLLGDHFENFDAGQINLRLWEGDVVFNNLVLKPTVIDNQDIPLKIVAGKLGSLHIKIPWRNLYTSSVELKLKDLLILIVPSPLTQYDASVEERSNEIAKRKEIQRFTETRRKLEERRREHVSKTDGTFTEKLLSQIIKNIQISIETVHIRYEDGITRPGNPFAFGITLERLQVQTTDDMTWEPSSLPTDGGGTFNKLVTLEDLSLYWNSNAELIQNLNMSRTKMLSILLEYIVLKNVPVTCILGPVNITAKVAISPKPATGSEPFSRPKYWVHIEIDKLALGINNLQFLDIVQWVDSNDLRRRGQIYRKYRPACSEYRGYYKQWWIYAFECIVQEDVRRRSESWDWLHIRRHRHLCRTYSKAYHKKLSRKRLNPAVMHTLSHCEKMLNVININLIRSQVEMRVKNSARVNADDKLSVNMDDGHDDNAHRLDYPAAYEDVFFNFVLKTISITFYENRGPRQQRNILHFEINNFMTTFKRRPADFGIKATMSLGGLTGSGFQNNSRMDAPTILVSEVPEIGGHLFSFSYEHRPLDSIADHGIQVKGNGVQIIYDVETISKLINSFTVPSETKLAKIHEDSSTGNEMTSISASCLEYILDAREEFEVDVQCRAPVFLIPQNTAFERDSPVLVVDMGEITIKSKSQAKNWRKDNTINFRRFITNDEQYMQKLLQVAYDSYTIGISNFQINLRTQDREYLSGFSNLPYETNYTISKPILRWDPIVITLSLSLIPDYMRVPRFHVYADCPPVTLDISEQTLKKLLKLLVTLPLPHAQDMQLHHNSLVVNSGDLHSPVNEDSFHVGHARMLLRASVEAVKFRVTCKCGHEKNPIIDVGMSRLQLGLTCKPHVEHVDIEIAGFAVSVLQKGSPVHILKTTVSSGSDRNLINIKFIKMLENVTKSKRQYVKVEVVALEVLLHQEAILSVVGLANRVSKYRDTGGKTQENISPTYDAKELFSNTQEQELGNIPNVSTDSRNENHFLKLDVKIDSISVQLSTERKDILAAYSSAVDFSIVKTKGEKSITLVMGSLCVLNMDRDCLYRKAITAKGESAVVVKVVTLDDGSNDVNTHDVQIHGTSFEVYMVGPKIVYIRSFVDEVMHFLANIGTSGENEFQTAVKETEEHVVPTSSRILLNVNLKDPNITIPRNKHSVHGLYLTPGHIKLQNQFSEREVEELQKIAIIETITVRFSQAALYRIHFDETTQNIQSQVSIWDPLECMLYVDKNKSSDLNHIIPFYDVDGFVGKLTMRMSSVDYNLIMACIHENVNAPYMPNIESAANVGNNNAVEMQTREAENGNVSFVEMRASMAIDEMNFSMYQQDSFQLENMEGAIERNPITSFAIVTIEQLWTKSENFSNQSRSCTVEIGNISVNDSSGTRGVTNLIQRKPYATGPRKEDAVHLTYIASEKDGTNLKVTTHGLSILYDLDSFQNILQFFRASDSGTKSDDLVEVSNSNTLPPTSDAENQYKFKTEWELSSTEIILVETMDSVDTRALLLNIDGTISQKNTLGESKLYGSANTFTLSSCVYNPDNRESSTAEIITPMSIGVDWKSTEKDSIIDVSMSNTYIRLSACTVKLLANILAAAGAGSTSNDQEIIDYKDVWDPKEITDQDFWFLKSEDGHDAQATLHGQAGTHRNGEIQKQNEMFTLKPCHMIFSFETGTGNNIVPLLRIETDVMSQVANWSHLMQMESTMNLEAACCSTTGTWECIIERPWEILLNYSMQANAKSVPYKDVTRKLVSLQSNDLLELSVTKTVISALNMLCYDFSSAENEVVSPRAVSTVPYNIVNEIGLEVILCLKENGRKILFSLRPDMSGCAACRLKPGKSIYLYSYETKDVNLKNTGVQLGQQGNTKRTLSVKIPEIGFKKAIPIAPLGRKCYPLSDESSHDHYGLVCDIGLKDCTKVVTLRGTVQIINELDIAVDIHCTMDGKIATLGHSAGPCNGFSLPLQCTNSEACSIFFSIQGYSVSRETFKLDAFMKSNQFIKEMKLGTDSEPFNFTVVGEINQLICESTNGKKMTNRCCTIYLKPPLLVKNLLPVPIVYYIGGTHEETKFVDRGGTIPVTDIKVGILAKNRLMFQIPNYLNKSWKSDFTLNLFTREVASVLFVAEDGSDEFLTLRIRREKEKGQTVLQLYSPYWIMNKTCLNLLYKVDGRNRAVYHAKDEDKPIMFTVSVDPLFEKKKFIKLQVKGALIHGSTITTRWSGRVSLESDGFIICKSPLQNFQIGMEIKTSSWGLTHFVTFAPRFCIYNQCPFNVFIIELDATANEIEIPSGACVSFWPKCQRPYFKAAVEILNRRSETCSFKCNTADNTVLQVANEVGGLHLEIGVTESFTTITLNKFVPTQAPAVLINKCRNVAIGYSEGNSQDKYLLCPGEWQYFTWKNHHGPKLFKWGTEVMLDTRRTSRQNELLRDGRGKWKTLEPITGQKMRCYWISFLHNSQRCLLFTEDRRICKLLKNMRTTGPVCNYSMHLHGIGLSLVDKEMLMYIRMSSSGVVWEQYHDHKSKFRPVTEVNTKSMEIAYQDYLSCKSVPKLASSTKQFDSGLLVDFDIMHAIEPDSVPIRRVSQTGVWISYKILPQSTHIHAKISRIQVDNHLQDDQFQVVLAPVKSSEDDIQQKPFVEVSLMRQTNLRSNVMEVKHATISVEELLLNVDLKFASSLKMLLAGGKAAEYWQEKFRTEIKRAHMSRDNILPHQISPQIKEYLFEYLHFSALRLHLNLSIIGSTRTSNPFLKYGLNLTDINDTSFEFSSFKIKNKLLSHDQFMSDVSSHYKSLCIDQIRVLALGRDVMDFSQEFAMDISNEIESFLTRSFQLALTANGEGHRRRKILEKWRQTAERVKKYGKEKLVKFVDVVDAAFVDALEGGKKDGVEGFFKGALKGAMVQVARQAIGGVVSDEFGDEETDSLELP